MLKNKQIHFVSGLPRSGSTLLSALLRQNPRFKAEMSSPVAGLFDSLLFNMSAGHNENAVHISDEQRKDILSGVIEGYYKREMDAEVIFDTNRYWSSKLPTLDLIHPESKVICCVRNVAWIMDSFESAFQRNPLQYSRFFNNESESNNLYSRIDTLARRDRVVGFAYSALKEAFYGNHASKMLIVDYDILVTKPLKTLELIYQFIDEPLFSHNIDDVSYSSDKFDESLGVPNLHKVSGAVKPRARRTILPPDLFEQYSNMEFWHNNENSAAHIISAV